MDQLWAVKQNFDPFPARIFINYNPLAIFRCTVYRCPYCRVIFKMIWGLNTTFMGQGERLCWRCHRKFWDSSQEWSEMSGSERKLFLLPISVAGWLAGTMVVSGLVIYTLWTDRWASITNPWFVVVLLAPLVFWFGYRSFQIFRSVRRYNRRGSQKTA